MSPSFQSKLKNSSRQATVESAGQTEQNWPQESGKGVHLGVSEASGNVKFQNSSDRPRQLRQGRKRIPVTKTRSLDDV